MTRLPDHILQPLLAFDILPTQSGGELFLQMSLERAPDDNPNGMNGPRWTDWVVRSDRLDPTNPAHSRSTLVRTTGWFDTFVMACLSRLPDPDAPGEKDSIIDQSISLWNSVSNGKDSALYTDLENAQAYQDMINWHQLLRALPTVPLAVAKWRHWKPGKLQDDTPVTQRQLETELRRRWAERLISHLAPYADKIPYVQTIEGENMMKDTLTFWGTPGLELSAFDALPWRVCRKLGSHQSPGRRRTCGISSTISAHRRSHPTSCRGSGIPYVGFLPHVVYLR